MASELRVNTLKDAAGNNSIATSFVANGSAKAWVKFDNDATINASFSISSTADNGTGDFSITIANAMSSVHYASFFSDSPNGSNQNVHGFKNTHVPTTTVNRVENQNVSNAFRDIENGYFCVLGDLA